MTVVSVKNELSKYSAWEIRWAKSVLPKYATQLQILVWLQENPIVNGSFKSTKQRKTQHQ